MACYNPLWAEPYPLGHSKYGQYKVLPVTRNNCDLKRQVDAEGKVWSFDHSTGELYDLIRIPCGKCVGCRLDYAREWSSRIVMESFDYPCNSLFVTLTYDDDHLPCYIKDSDKVYHGVDWTRRNGELHGATLVKKDTQDWLKRLRRTVDYNYDESNRMPIRYYLAGEYGSKGHRPHYHVCLFGLPDDLVQEGTSKLGHPLFQSPLINETWGQGFTVVGELNATTASYTARYTLKKAQGQDHAYNDALGIEREFVTMSRKPGIGLNYYERHKDQIYERDEIILPAISKDKPNVVRPPRYFDIKYGGEDPKAMAKIKAMREEAQELLSANNLAGVQLNEVDYLEVQERKRSEQVKKLIRDL